MTIIFWLIIILMIGIALYAILPSLLKNDSSLDDHDAEQLNTSIYQQKLAELKQAHEEGLLDDESYEIAKEESALALLNDADNDNETLDTSVKQHTPSTNTPFILVALIVPALAISLYLFKGKHRAIDPTLYPKQSNDQSALSMESVIEQLEKKINIGDDSAENWFMLGRAYLEMGQLEKAKEAFAKANQQRTNQVDIMLDYAEVLARLNDNRFTDESIELIKKALQQEPTSRRARWLASVIDTQKGNSAKALKTWQQLLAEGTENREEQRMLEMLIARHGGSLDQSTTTQATSNGPSITIQVSIAASIVDKVSANDAVFIFARAAQGPKIPLAVVKKQVSDLPITVALSDSQAMTPQMKLSNFDNIVIGARISKTGNAIPSSGDFQSLSNAVLWKEKELVEIEILDIIP